MNQALPGRPEPSPFVRILSSFFYTGYAPVAPGTAGSLATFPLYFLLVHFGDWRLYLAALLIIIAAGIWAAERAEQQSKITDPSFVVIDEVAGQLATLFLIPVSWKTALAGFLLFRIFDVIKPFPARRAERLHGGWGIMTDDIIAGIYGNLLIRLVIFLYR